MWRVHQAIAVRPAGVGGDGATDRARREARRLTIALAGAGLLACAALLEASRIPNEPAVLVLIASVGLFVVLLRRLTS